MSASKTKALRRINSLNFFAKFVLLVVFISAHKSLFADLHYYPYRLELSSPKITFGLNEPMEFMLHITNLSTEDQTFLVPGSQNKGLKMIYFSFFTVDENNHYTEMMREVREIVLKQQLISFLLSSSFLAIVWGLKS